MPYNKSPSFVFSGQVVVKTHQLGKVLVRQSAARRISARLMSA